MTDSARAAIDRAVVLDLPLPPKECHQNRSGRRGGLRAEMAAKREARQWAAIAAIRLSTTGGYGELPRWKYCAVSLHFRFPDRRRRDIFNYAGACKNFLDGIGDAGVYEDDSGIVWGTISCELDRQNPGVTIAITPIFVKCGMVRALRRDRHRVCPLGEHEGVGGERGTMMAQRTTWKFEFSTKDLAEAARDCIGHHAQRLAFWEGELARIEPEIKDSLQLVEYPVTGGNRLDMHIAPELQRRYTECTEKIKEHRSRRDEYERWLRMFALNPGEKVALDVDDIAFFGL